MFYMNNIARNTIYEIKLSKLCLGSVLNIDFDICIFVYSALTPYIFKPVEIISMNSCA